MKQERFIKCVMTHSMHWSNTEERPVDRVAAIGMVTRHNEEIMIGEKMLRVDALDADSLRSVILKTSRRLNHRHRINWAFAKKMTFAVLHELLRQNCIHCGGQGNIHQKGSVTVTCSHCAGSGLHFYTNGDREALIGNKYNQKAYEDALNYLRDSVYEIVRRSEKRLEG